MGMVACFDVAPQHWIHWRENAVGVYDNIKKKAQVRVTIVPLCRRENECKSHLE